MFLILKAKTHKGKNRIKELGARWIVLNETINPRTNKESFFVGAELDPSKHMRWIDKDNSDKDFQIERIENED